MECNLQLRPVTSVSIEALINFAKLHPWSHHWPEETIRRFLTQLSSSLDLAFDVYDGDQRIAVGVLLDKIQNKGNYANLEVLGVLSDANQSDALRIILSAAKSRVPSIQSGLEVGFHSSFPMVAEFTKQNNLKIYYETFDMINEKPYEHAKSAEDEVTVATVVKNKLLYDSLVKCFAENVETSIPSFDDWEMAHRQAKSSKTWIIEEDNQIVAFLHLIIAPDSTSAEIRTVGVLPPMRGKGFAKKLLRHALHHSAQLHLSSCKLTVAVINAKALNLYRQLGFKEENHYQVYCWDKSI